ncbi:MAG: division/cell wall cluster transcriptional repressor MraZ [Thermoleophilia bacterium]|jgi:MraZ protein|nr:division/cell wall cluster transcriptional repressor MraZ [Thermoleophilia bacterium]MEE4275157.1 division/cell wall cluster transcriptional repressor MraZ [Thermoleophilia bacterium]
MQRPVLVGEFECTLDAKNRIAIPARLRSAFAEGIYVTRGHERCLAAYPPEGFERFLEEQTQGVSTLKSKVRALERFAAASAVHQELDRQGRITLPARHLQFAAIGRETTVIGVRDHIEIWDRAAWAAYLAHLEEEADATADELATP